eukprot:7009963-Pyramimonas_sp.AAC.1
MHRRRASHDGWPPSHSHEISGEPKPNPAQPPFYLSRPPRARENASGTDLEKPCDRALLNGQLVIL